MTNAPLSPEHRFRAKRANEGVRIFAAFINNLAVGTVIAGFLSPLASGHPESAWVTASLFFAAGVLHLLARVAIHRLYQRED